MRKAERLFQLVNLIRVRQPVTASALARELGVSVRSVYRYVDDLSLSGIPVYGEAGIGYRLHEGFELPPLTLTREELEALLLGVEMVSISTGTRLPLAATRLAQKIQAVLPAALRHGPDTATHALSVVDRADAAQCWERLRHAIQAQHIVRLQYRDANGAVSQRRVMPLGLFYWGGKWTLAGWCLSRRAFREFRLDRMSALRTSVHGFRLTAGRDLRTYMQQQAANWPPTPTAPD